MRTKPNLKTKPNSRSNSRPNTKPFHHEPKHRGSSSPVLPNVNITDLARTSGMNRTHLSRVLNGWNKAGMHVLERLRDALGMESVEHVSEWLRKLKVKQ